jgi:penicillin amidase
MRYFYILVLSIFTLFLALAFNGSLSFSKLLPVGKILDPYHGIWQNTKGLPTKLNLSTENISNAIHVVLDDREVPHIFAENLCDALYAQGYLAASNRLFQMDLTARSSGGRLSELFGKRTIDRDIEIRKKGYLSSAKMQVEKWKSSPDSKYINAYINGVNKYISQLAYKDLPVEYKLTNTKPEAWTLLNSQLIQKSMARTLAGRTEDIPNSNLRSALGDDLYNELYSGINPKDIPIIPAEKEYSFTPVYDDYDSTMNIIKTFPHKTYEQPAKGLGSNNWAVTGNKSVTGNPILCNDPHLQLTLPSIWYEIQIHTPKFNAYGVSIPGVPGIVIGFNEDMAWGETNVGQDITDWYNIKYVSNEKTHYYLDGEKRKVEVKKEIIKVRNGKNIELDIPYTDWGPIIFESNDAQHDLAMSWLGNSDFESTDFMVFVNAMRTKSYEEYLEISKDFMVPAQNFLAADRQGNIGIRINGIFAAKQFGDGVFVKDGSNSRAGFDTFIPREQNPQILNPSSEHISSANQRSAAENYPYFYNGGFENYRGRIIHNYLENNTKMDVEKMKNFQLNVTSLKGKELLPILLKNVRQSKLSEKEGVILKKLQSWDYKYSADSEAATYFHVWNRKVMRGIFDEILDLREEMSVVFPPTWKTNNLIIENPTHTIFDNKQTDNIEHASDIITQALVETAEDLEGKENIAWGSYRAFKIPHISRIPSFSSKEVITGGNGDVLNAITGRTGPSWRMIVATGEEVEAYGIYPGGQSGNPASKNYKNSVQDWANGQYYKLSLYDNPELVENNSSTIRIQPKN